MGEQLMGEQFMGQQFCWPIFSTWGTLVLVPDACVLDV